MNEIEKKTNNRDKLNILVVDDELNIRKTISMCLEIEGHSVRTVSNFDDAVEEIKQRLFDVVFLDLRLGTKNGLDLLPYLQSHSPTAKVVVITAYTSVAYRTIPSKFHFMASKFLLTASKNLFVASNCRMVVSNSHMVTSNFRIVIFRSRLFTSNGCNKVYFYKMAPAPLGYK